MKYIRFISRSGSPLTVMFDGGDYTHQQFADLLGLKAFSGAFVAIDNPKVRVSGFVPSLGVGALPADANAIALALIRTAALYPPMPERTAAATYPWSDELTPEEKAAIEGTPAPAAPFPDSILCSCEICGMQFKTPSPRPLCAGCETARYEGR